MNGSDSLGLYPEVITIGVTFAPLLALPFTLLLPPAELPLVRGSVLEARFDVGVNAVAATFRRFEFLSTPFEGCAPLGLGALLKETFNLAGLVAGSATTLALADFAGLAVAFMTFPPDFFLADLERTARRGADRGLRDFSVRGSGRAGMSPRSYSLLDYTTVTSTTAVLHVGGHTY